MDLTLLDGELLNRYFRVLFALREFPIRVTAEFPVKTCHKEVGRAMDAGHIEHNGEAYVLTASGREALANAVVEARARADREGPEAKQNADWKRVGSSIRNRLGMNREQTGLLKYGRMLYALKDGRLPTLKKIDERALNGQCNEEVRSAIVQGHVEKNEGYALTESGRAHLAKLLTSQMLSDSEWAAELERRKPMQTLIDEFDAAVVADPAKAESMLSLPVFRSLLANHLH